MQTKPNIHPESRGRLHLMSKIQTSEAKVREKETLLYRTLIYSHTIGTRIFHEQTIILIKFKMSVRGINMY